MRQREMSMVESFFVFLAGFGLIYFGVKNGDAILAAIGGIVAVLGLILLAPNLYRFRVEVFDIKIKLLKTFWASNWFYYAIAFSVVYWITYFLPPQLQTWMRAAITGILILSILYSMSSRLKRKIDKK